MGFVHDSYNCLKQLAFVCICWNKPLLSCFVLGNYSANVQFLSSSIMISFCFWSKIFLMFTSYLYCDSQLSGASPELVNKLIPEHVRRQIGLSFFHPAGT